MQWKSFLRFNQTPYVLEQSLTATTEVKSALPTDKEMATASSTKVSSHANGTHPKNTDFDMQEFLGIDKALQTIQMELEINTSKLAKIVKHIKKDSKKFKEFKDNPTILKNKL